MEFIKDFGGLLAFLSLVIISVVYLFSAKRKETHQAQKERADASEELLGTRDRQLNDCKAMCEECRDELEQTTGELRTVVSIKIEELISFWQEKEEIELENDTLRDQVRRLEKRLANSL